MGNSYSLEDAVDLLVEALGQQSSFWGFGKTTGEIFGVLYMSSEPLTLGEIAQALKVTKGNISVAIRNLEHLGMVRRSWQRGDRKIYFTAENDFWKITRSVLEQRHKPEFDHSFHLIERSLALAHQSVPSQEKDDIISRLDNLSSFYRSLDAVVAALLRLDPSHLPALAMFLAGQEASKNTAKNKEV